MYNVFLGIVLIVFGLELFAISLYQFIENRKSWDGPVFFRFALYSILAAIVGILFIGCGFFALLLF